MFKISEFARNTAIMMTKDRTITYGAKEALQLPYTMNSPTRNDLYLKPKQRSLRNQQLLKIIIIKLLLLIFLNMSHSIAAETEQSSDSLDITSKEKWFYLAPENRTVYDKFYSQIQQQLKSKNIIRINSNSEIECKVNENETQIFITAGITALKNIKHCAKTSKIFAFYLTQQQFFNLKNETHDTYKDSNVFFADQALIRQLALARYFLPKSNNVGIIFTESVQHQIHYFKNRKPQFIHLEDFLITSNGTVLKQLSKATANSDFILALIDNNTYNSRNAKSILLSTYRKNIPIFGGTRGFVKAGIVASCYSVPEKLVNELTNFIKLNASATGVRRYPIHFEIEQNIPVSHSFDLKTSKKSEIKKYIKETLLLWRNP